MGLFVYINAKKVLTNTSINELMTWLLYNNVIFEFIEFFSVESLVKFIVIIKNLLLIFLVF